MTRPLARLPVRAQARGMGLGVVLAVLVAAILMTGLVLTVIEPWVNGYPPPVEAPGAAPGTSILQPR